MATTATETTLVGTAGGQGGGDKWKVAIIGSGNWGSAIARIIGINATKKPDLFDSAEVRMWCFEEQYNGSPLTTQINSTHTNPKYLPGVLLSPNIIADPSLISAVKNANALVFVVPHQFIPDICRQLKEAGVGKGKGGCRAISLVKGVEVKEEKIEIFADVISEQLGIPCSALSGANIADEVARDKFSETTIGCREAADGERWKELFETDNFRVSVTDDVRGVSLCGALKNVVAVAAGFVDGLQWGNNAKAAIMRIGLLEMKRFSQEFFDGIKSETFVQESAGIADLITSCLGGRNRRCAEAFVTSSPHKSFDQLEKEMLKGQKLQGVATARELNGFLKKRGREKAYPLFTVVYKIAYEGIRPETLTSHL